MDLKFSHVDILVSDLEKTASYYQRVLGYKRSKMQTWKRADFHVDFFVMIDGDERIMFGHPHSGNLKDLLDEKGEGTIYRYCFTTKDIKACHRELVSREVQPEDENGNPISEDDLDSPVGVPSLWLPRVFGDLSMEIVEEESMDSFMGKLKNEIS